jgi:phage shock protein A
MRMFTRISTSVMAALDRAVSTMENHDALVEAAINEVRQAIGQARARLQRVQSDSERLRARIVAFRGSAEQWVARAVQAGVSEDTALECLRRRRDCGIQIEQSEDLLGQHQALAERLHENLRRMESRLRELQRQRDVLRTREAAAEVLRVGETFHGSSAAADVDRALERWDARIAADESVNEPSAHVDALERSFLADEERASLRDELRCLQSGEEG